MRLSEICVKRPVFAFMLILFLVVLGVFVVCRTGRGPVSSDRSGHGLRARPASRRLARGGDLAGGHASRRGDRFGQRH